MAWLLASDTLIKRKKTAEGDLDEQLMFILMPMIDAINHDSNLPTTAFEFNSLADKFEMASAGRVGKGEQVSVLNPFFFSFYLVREKASRAGAKN